MKTFPFPIFATAVALVALPFAAVAEDPPAEQLADLKILLSSSDTAEILPAQARLREILQTRGEPGEVLAQHIMDVVAETKRPPEWIFHLFSARAYTLDENKMIVPHIDGPYLKRLALMSIPDDANHRYFRDYRPAVAYLKLNPEDRGEIYWRLRLNATRDAKTSRFPSGERLLIRKDDDFVEGVRDFVRAHYPTPVSSYSLDQAWDILIQLGVLKPGMTVGDAEKILGERFDAKAEDGEEKWIRWYHDTPRHVNPCLNAEVKEGKIVSFHSGSA